MWSKAHKGTYYWNYYQIFGKKNNLQVWGSKVCAYWQMDGRIW
jgi:hypothetical protein